MNSRVFMTEHNSLLYASPESTDAAEPFGPAGPVVDRDPTTGRFTPGNRASIVSGRNSASFWRDVAAIQKQREAEVFSDLGFTHPDDAEPGQQKNPAPHVMLTVVRGLIQSELIRDSAFLRVVESGGVLSATDERRRNAYRVWREAAEETLSHARQVGLERRTKQLDYAQAFAAEADRGDK